MTDENASKNQLEQPTVLMIENGRKVKKIVLDEELFVTKLDRIVERDYFPDLKKLKTDHQQFELDQTDDQIDANLSLGQFLSKYTSEDNASFNEVIEATNKRHRDKYPWFYLNEDEIQKQIESALDLSIEGAPNKTENLITWPYRNMNSIMFNPDGHQLTVKEQIEANSQNKQEIVIENTRFRKPPFRRLVRRLNTGQTDTSTSTDTTNDSSKQFVQSKYDPTGDLISLKPKEYKLVESTPLIEPEQISTPLMTWGEIESTPMLIETEIECTPSSGRFKIPELSVREQTALKLTDNYTKSKKQNTNHSLSRRWTPSPRTPRHLDQLSPAVQHFAQSKLRLNIKNDMRNISSSFLPTKSPSPFHRSLSNVRSSGNKSVESDCSTITDDLLNLSKND